MDRLNLAINVYLKHLEARAGEIKERDRNFTNSNLSSDEQDALKKLEGYRDIIKETNKGGLLLVGIEMIVVKKLVGSFTMIGFI